MKKYFIKCVIIHNFRNDKYGTTVENIWTSKYLSWLKFFLLIWEPIFILTTFSSFFSMTSRKWRTFHLESLKYKQIKNFTLLYFDLEVSHLNLRFRPKMRNFFSNKFKWNFTIFYHYNKRISSFHSVLKWLSIFVNSQSNLQCLFSKHNFVYK